MKGKVTKEQINEYEYEREELFERLGVGNIPLDQIEYVDLSAVAFGMNTKYRLKIKIRLQNDGS